MLGRNFIGRASRCMPNSLFFYNVYKVVKQDLKITKIWAKYVPKPLT